MLIECVIAHEFHNKSYRINYSGYFFVLSTAETLLNQLIFYSISALASGLDVGTCSGLFQNRPSKALKNVQQYVKTCSRHHEIFYKSDFPTSFLCEMVFSVFKLCATH